MLLIGSDALRHHGIEVNRKTFDKDYICTYDEYNAFVKENRPASAYPLNGNHMVTKFKDGRIIEFEIAWEGSSAEDILSIETGPVASLEMLLLLKTSHRFKKDSPHFHKTRMDIKLLKEVTSIPKEWKQLLKKREKETYTNVLPKLNKSKQDFFTDAVEYDFDHDSIHAAIAIDDRPAYTYFMKDGAEVMADMKKWDTLPFRIKLNAALEETGVLAIERSIYKFGTNPRKAFEFALMKLSTSISSGKFRAFCYNNFDKILDNYRPDFYDKFKVALAEGRIKPFKSA